VIFGAKAVRSYAATTSPGETETFEGDLEVMLECLRRVGIERAIVVDLSIERLSIPVVKVIVPGLEGPPFMPDYAEGERARRARRAMS
jgi:ribosomal protein S12 methylthiotransferase accessory factor